MKIRRLKFGNIDLMNDGYFLDKEDLLGLIRIQNTLLIYEDIVATLEQCCDLWQRTSWDVQASWLFIPDNEEQIISYIKSQYFTNYEEYLRPIE